MVNLGPEVRVSRTQHNRNPVPQGHNRKAGHVSAGNDEWKNEESRRDVSQSAKSAFGSKSIPHLLNSATNSSSNDRFR
jgi:hypothetical protein